MRPNGVFIKLILQYCFLVFIKFFINNFSKDNDPFLNFFPSDFNQNWINMVKAVWNYTFNS